MRRRLATLMAVSMFALTLGATPAFADSHVDGHGDHWVILMDTSTNLGVEPYVGTDLGGMLDCSAGHHRSTYTMVSGFLDQVLKVKGSISAEFTPLGPGQVVETWTLRDVRIRSDQTQRTYRVVGSSRAISAFDATGWTSESFVQDVNVQGTRDGRSFRQAGDGNSPMVMVWDRGTCSNLQLGLN